MLLIPTLEAGEVTVVANVLIAMSLGLVPLGAMVLMKWVYYAFEDGRSVFYFQIPVLVTLLALAYLATVVLPSIWWVAAVGLAMSVSNLVAVLLRLKGLASLLEGADIPRTTRLHVQLV